MELLLQTERSLVAKSSLVAAAFFGQPEWFEGLRSKIVTNSAFTQNDTQCLTAAIEGGNTPILNACLESSHEPNGTDDHGWTLHMVAIQSRNRTAMEIFRDASEEHVHAMSVTRWEVNPIISPFVGVIGDGTSLVYSGSLLPWGLSVRGNHPFPPGNMGPNYFEVEVLDSVESSDLCIGFCGECVLHQGLAGSYRRSSAYYAGGSLRKDSRWFNYGKRYSKGDIVGCGIDWGNSQFFFTLNGRQLKTMNYVLQYRIYPVVGFCGRKVIRISARFAGPFKYIRRRK